MTQEELIEKAAELRPCPFCGGKAYLRTYGGTHSRPTDGASLVVIDCGLCVSKIERYGRERAVEAWNTRVIQPPRIVTDNSKAAALLQVRVRELEEQLGVMRYCLGVEHGKAWVLHSDRLVAAIAAYDSAKEAK